MRALIAVCALLTLFAATAMSPEYHSYRKWIEDHHPKDSTPAAKRLFIQYSADGTKGTTILRFRKGIGLREIIDGTPLKGKTVGVYVLRPTQKTKASFDEKVQPSALPTFEVQPLDLVFLHGSMLPRW